VVRFPKDPGVEAVHGDNRIGRFHRPDQRLVVVQPEVAPEPQDHGSVLRGSHVSLCKQRAALLVSGVIAGQPDVMVKCHIASVTACQSLQSGQECSAIEDSFQFCEFDEQRTQMGNFYLV
jgi:hypothetical protein